MWRHPRVNLIHESWHVPVACKVTWNTHQSRIIAAAAGHEAERHGVNVIVTHLNDSWMTPHKQHRDMLSFILVGVLILEFLAKTDLRWVEFFPFVELRRGYVD